MTDSQTHDAQALEQISVERDYETRYWARTLHCTETELREAVRTVGTDVDSVRRHLGPRAGQPGPSNTSDASRPSPA